MMWRYHVGAASSALAVMLAVALPAVALGAGGSAAGGGGAGYVWGVFTPTCYGALVGGDLGAFDATCIKVTVSKLLGFAIIAGACVVKVPQIIAILRSRSVEGIDPLAVYTDLLSYLLTLSYHLVRGSMFSSFGEAAVITVQSIAIVLIMWSLNPPGTAHSAAVAAGLAVATGLVFNLPTDLLAYVIGASTLVNIVSRFSQALANYRQAGVGQQSVITLFMNFAGSAARVFTSSVEVKQVEVLLSFMIAAALNGLLLGQYVYYVFLAPTPQDRKAAPAPPPAAAAPAPTPAAAAPAADAGALDGPASAAGKRTSAGGARKRPTQA